MKQLKLGKILVLVASALLIIFSISACNNNAQQEQTQSESSQQSEQVSQSQEQNSQDIPAGEKPMVRVATLKGPTGMGMAGLMDMNEQNTTANRYEFSLKTNPADARAAIISGEADIAAMPTNMAAILYNKDKGSIKLLAINALGVLSIMENGDTIQSFADLSGKTLYSTGQGAAPEYVLNYLLEQNGITDTTVEYLAEHAELATQFISEDVKLGMLPQPFVTSIMQKNENVRIALDITQEWNKITDGKELTMGCIVVSTKFAEENPQAIQAFLDEYEQSVKMTNRDIEDAAQLIEKYDIVTAQVAAAAIPNSNIVYYYSQNIKDSVNEFLQILYDANAQSIGGAVPDDEFYYSE